MSTVLGCRSCLPRLGRIFGWSCLAVADIQRREHHIGPRRTADGMMTPDELCTLVARGELIDPDRVSNLLERYWKSVVEWAALQRVSLPEACE